MEETGLAHPGTAADLWEIPAVIFTPSMAVTVGSDEVMPWCVSAKTRGLSPRPILDSAS